MKKTGLMAVIAIVAVSALTMGVSACSLSTSPNQVRDSTDLPGDDDSPTVSSVQATSEILHG